jgi:hypothetical protein
MRTGTFLATIAASSLLALVIWPDTAPAFSRSPSAKRRPPAALRQQREEREADAYTGRIATKRGFCVLVNPNSETTYGLDDQHKAKRFLGKDVIVIGTRNILKNTIHVSEIRFNKSS